MIKVKYMKVYAEMRDRMGTNRICEMSRQDIREIAGVSDARQVEKPLIDHGFIELVEKGSPVGRKKTKWRIL